MQTAAKWGIFIGFITLYYFVFCNPALAVTKTPTPIPTATPYSNIGINTKPLYENDNQYVEWVLIIDKKYVDIGELNKIKDLYTPYILKFERVSSLEYDGYVAIRLRVKSESYMNFLWVLMSSKAVIRYD